MLQFVAHSLSDMPRTRMRWYRSWHIHWSRISSWHIHCLMCHQLYVWVCIQFVTHSSVCIQFVTHSSSDVSRARDTFSYSTIRDEWMCLPCIIAYISCIIRVRDISDTECVTNCIISYKFVTYQSVSSHTFHVSSHTFWLVNTNLHHIFICHISFWYSHLIHLTYHLNLIRFGLRIPKGYISQTQNSMIESYTHTYMCVIWDMRLYRSW